MYKINPSKLSDSILPVQAKVDIKADVTEASTIISKGTVSGLSRLFNLVSGKREADIERYKVLSRAKTFREACEVYQEARHLLPASSPRNGSHKENGDLDLMRPMMEESEKNLLASLGIAYERIQSEPEMPEYSENEIPSQTLFNRWRHEAQFISEKELQQLWGNILAEEIIRPGSISLRTLDVLKNVSMAEAEIFSELCDYVIDDQYFLSVWKFDNKFDGKKKEYDINNISVLGELGFISNFEMATTGTLSLNNEIDLICQQHELKYGEYFLSFIIEKSHDLPVGKLTTVGKDLYKISKNVTLDKAINFSKLLFRYIDLIINDEVTIFKMDASNKFVKVTVVERPD